MSVLHLLGTAGEGGAETYFVDLVTALAADGGATAASVRHNHEREAALKAADVPTCVAGFGGPLDFRTRGRVAGFAAVRGSEVLHFGTALDTWGSGLAATAHDELVELLRVRGLERPALHVYAANARGRRFWEKHGWRPTGDVERGSFPPYAELLLTPGA